jgi:undecaprenyl diphosphate synthase
MNINHLSIIPDGNRRWAKQRGLEISEGHKTSGDYKKINSFCQAAIKEKIKFLSVWGFSTENWKREKKEIDNIFEVVENVLKCLVENVDKNKYKFIHIGRKDRLPKNLLELISKLEYLSAGYNNFTLIFALDYGGQDEILRAVNKLLKENILQINENSFRDYLDTKDIPDPDLIVRTGKEKRLSGFMCFQSAYSEIFFVNKYFPDLTEKDLRKIIKEFSQKERRFGGN